MVSPLALPKARGSYSAQVGKRHHALNPPLSGPGGDRSRDDRRATCRQPIYKRPSRMARFVLSPPFNAPPDSV